MTHDRWLHHGVMYSFDDPRIVSWAKALVAHMLEKFGVDLRFRGADPIQGTWFYNLRFIGYCEADAHNALAEADEDEPVPGLWLISHDRLDHSTEEFDPTKGFRLKYRVDLNPDSGSDPTLGAPGR